MVLLWLLVAGRLVANCSVTSPPSNQQPATSNQLPAPACLTTVGVPPTPPPLPHSMPDYGDLTDLQLMIMSVLWTDREATIGTIHERLNTQTPVARKTVAMILSRLEQRRLVSHRMDGREGVYKARVAKQSVLRSRMASLLGALFVGQPRLTGAHALDPSRRSHRRRRKNGCDDSATRTRREEGGLIMPTLIDGLVTSLLTYAIHSFAACALALAVSRMLRQPQDRDLLWKVTLVAPVLTAAFAVALSLNGSHGTGFIDLADLARRVSNVDLPGRQVQVRMLYTGSTSSVVRQFSDPVTTALSIASLAIILCVTFVALVRLANRRRALTRAVSGRRAMGALPLVARGSAVRLSAAPDLQSPVALGAAEICLPSEVVDTFSQCHQKSLIAHEVAHLERRDPAWFFAAELIAALSAFQPLGLCRASRVSTRRRADLRRDRRPPHERPTIPDRGACPPRIAVRSSLSPPRSRNRVRRLAARRARPTHRDTVAGRGAVQAHAGRL